MKFRPHRGNLVNAMKEVQEFTTLNQLKFLVSDQLDLDHREVDNLEINHYIYDDRIEWDTYVVIFRGSVVGFTDGVPK